MASRRTSGPRIDAAFLAIADGAPLDWRDIERSTNAAQLEVLRLLDDVAQAYRAEQPSELAAGRQVMFRWGALEVDALIGSGGYGEVYRAYDPWLRRTVALKLFRAGESTGVGLDEARQLARLRHRNVLNVYGCGVHDGRAGLWSELIDGRTLAAIVSEDGSLSEEEGLRVARDLAQALAIVHAAGLVHGDVKAENVMRERGGRIVLMDFGAGGDAHLLAARRVIWATPRYLSPEMLDGAAPSAQGDLYALGVLLFLIFSGRFPYCETDAPALAAAQRRSGASELRDLRPELAAPLCRLVQSCIAADAAQRPASASALAAQLTQLLRADVLAPSRGKNIWWLGGALLCAFAVAAATLAWSYLFQVERGPPAWHSGVKFVRVDASGDVELAANSTLHVGDRLRMSVDSTRPAYVYVLNEDAAGNATVLFPIAGSTMSNPVAAGTALRLPGGAASTLAWQVTADSAAEEFVVIAALQPVHDLDAQLMSWRHATDTDATRAVAGIVAVPPLVVRGEHLRPIVAELAHDPEHVHVWQYRFAHSE